MSSIRHVALALPAVPHGQPASRSYMEAYHVLKRMLKRVESLDVACHSSTISIMLHG